MKVKEIERTAVVSWSPGSQHPVLLASATAAQQLDATFSTTASLEIYALNLSEPGLDMAAQGSVTSDYRFHKLIWGGNSSDKGVIVGGADGGNLLMYDPDKVVQGEPAIVCKTDQHTGPVRTIDFNPFKSNLLASGASESEIYIWDLNNVNSPMTPGTKIQPFDDVMCVSWNRQVQHILASTFSTRCTVWDLRKNEPIIKVSDSTTRMRCKTVAWHPEIATQLCLASDDDHTPVIQLWDLRYATSPLKVLENHQRGVLSIAWCSQDSDLLLSCGKDNRILCWNPNSNVPGGEVLCELPTPNHWSFEVTWCPRNPAIIASSSFDGFVSVYSLMGGQQQTDNSSKITDSFPSSNAYGTATPQSSVSVSLKKPPKWLRKPVGASFGFGGKLISFETDNAATPASPAAHQGFGSGGTMPTNSTQQPQLVYVSQVITETDVANRSTYLEHELAAGRHVEFCLQKIDQDTDEDTRRVWAFLQASFDSDPKERFLNLLGYPVDRVKEKVARLAHSSSGNNLDHKLNNLGLSQHLSGAPAHSSVESRASRNRTPSEDFDAIGETQHEQGERLIDSPYLIPTNDSETEGLVTQALLVGDMETAVDICMQNNLTTEALLLALSAGGDLLVRTRTRYLKQVDTDLSKIIGAIVTRDWHRIIQSCNIENWQEALAGALTYSQPEEFLSLCELLGYRLETENGGRLKRFALLCYIGAGNVEKFVQCWSRCTNDTSSPVALQELVELVCVLARSIESAYYRTVDLGVGLVGEKLSEYALLLASQGSLNTALSFLGNSTKEQLTVLRHRLYVAAGYSLHDPKAPRFPFAEVDIKSGQEAPFSAPVPSKPGYGGNVPVSYGQHYGTSASSSSTNISSSGLSGTLSRGTSQYTGTSSISASGSSTSLTQPASTFPPPMDGFQPTSSYLQPVLPSVPSTQYASTPVAQSHPPVPPLAAPGTFPQASPYAVPPTSAPPPSFGLLQPTVSPTPPPPPPPASATPPQRHASGGSGGNIYSRSGLSHRYPTVPNPTAYSGPLDSGYSNAFSSTPSYGQPAMNGQYSPAYNSAAYQSDISSTPPYSNQAFAPDSRRNSGFSGPSPLLPPSAASNPDVKPGWNDPPLLHGQAKKETSYESVAPITHPLYGMGGDPQPQPNSAPPPAYSSVQYTNNNQYPGTHHYPPVETQYGETTPPTVTETPKRIEPPPVAKGPVPVEHQVVQEVFDALREKCLQVGTNPQIKRKLEDVAKKLDVLYDKLRNNELSQTTVLGVHQMIQAVQQSNYAAALQYHSNLISSEAFSEISDFMPGIKVLFQCASQLSVYVQ